MVRNKTRKNRKARQKQPKKRGVSRKKEFKTESIRKYFLSDEEKRRRRNNWIVMILAILFIGGAYWGVVKRKNPEFEQVRLTTEEILKKNEGKWLLKYWNGYKVLTIYNGKVLESSLDTLPEEIKINWSNLKVRRAKPEELRENPGMAHIVVPLSNILPSGLIDQEIVKPFTRQQGESIQINNFEGKDLYMELIEVYENSLVLIFGIL